MFETYQLLIDLVGHHAHALGHAIGEGQSDQVYHISLPHLYFLLVIFLCEQLDLDNLNHKSCSFSIFGVKLDDVSDSILGQRFRDGSGNVSHN